MNKNPIKCEKCGKFIAYNDISNNVKVEYTPDTEYTIESTKFIHLKCINNDTKQNKVEEAAENLGYSFDTYESFKSGVEYAESELSELFIDFLIWYETSDIQNRKLKYAIPVMCENFDIRKLAKEIFDIFLEERNKTSK